MWLPLLGTGWADRAAACSYIGDNKTLGIEMVEWKNLQVQIPIPSSGRQATDRQFLRGRGWPLMHLQYTENCNSKFCPKTPQPRKESSPFPPTLPARARNQVPGDQFMLTNVYNFADHCSQDGMDRNAPNLNPRYNSTEISRIGGQTSRPTSKPPWRDVPPPAASSRDILPKGRPHKISAQSALFSR